MKNNLLLLFILASTSKTFTSDRRTAQQILDRGYQAPYRRPNGSVIPRGSDEEYLRQKQDEAGCMICCISITGCCIGAYKLANLLFGE